MRCRVQLIVSGKVFYEQMEVRDYDDARRTALARNPTARVLHITAVFK